MYKAKGLPCCLLNNFHPLGLPVDVSSSTFIRMESVSFPPMQLFQFLFLLLLALFLLPCLSANTGCWRSTIGRLKAGYCLHIEGFPKTRLPTVWSQPTYPNHGNKPQRVERDSAQFIEEIQHQLERLKNLSYYIAALVL